MYSTCIFCHASLGSNETIEQFPIGRCLAFDTSKGRLWVVCRVCVRWNLTPIHQRWEAIEAAERLFQDTKLRVSTDQIGLARLRGGLELIRIGAPKRPEFAAWRYGDQFGRRRRGAFIKVGAATAALATGIAGGVSSLGVLGLAYAGLYAAISLPDYWLKERVLAHVSIDSGEAWPVKRRDLRFVRLMQLRAGDAWSLWLSPASYTGYVVEASGERAVQAAALLLPHINRFAGMERHVTHAVAALEQADSPDAYIAQVARAAGVLTTLPPEVRLAVEMAANEDAERRAMEGELSLLEQAWHDAEEIAAIADSLLVPPSVERMLVRLRQHS